VVSTLASASDRSGVGGSAVDVLEDAFTRSVPRLSAYAFAVTGSEAVEVTDDAADVHLLVRAVDADGGLGEWFDPQGGPLARLEFVAAR